MHTLGKSALVLFVCFGQLLVAQHGFDHVDGGHVAARKEVLSPAFFLLHLRHDFSGRTALVVPMHHLRVVVLEVGEFLLKLFFPAFHQGSVAAEELLKIEGNQFLEGVDLLLHAFVAHVVFDVGVDKSIGGKEPPLLGFQPVRSLSMGG